MSGPAAGRKATRATSRPRVAITPTTAALTGQGMGGKVASPTHLAGGAANAALMLATAGLANAYASRGVRVVGVNPGATETERLTEGLAASARLMGVSLDEARKRGLRLVLAVANNWPSANTDEKRRSGANTDNKFAYADAVGAVKVVNGRVVGEDAFFTNPKAKQAYKDHLSVLANRVNSINGRKYKGE